MALEIKPLLNLWVNKETAIADFLQVDDYTYILDKFNHRILIFDNNGQMIKKIGSFGTGEREFNYPAALALDQEKRLFIADSYNNRIQVLSIDGEYLYSFGGFGVENDRFIEPIDICIGQRNTLYIVDRGNNRIKKTDAHGNVILIIDVAEGVPGILKYPNAITLDEHGNIYVADSGNYRICKFDQNGNGLLSFGTRGNDRGQFISLSSLVIEGDLIFISDELKESITIYTKNGFFIEKINGVAAISKMKLLSQGLTFVEDSQLKLLSSKYVGSEVCIVERKMEQNLEENLTTEGNLQLGWEILARCYSEVDDFERALGVLEEVDKLRINDFQITRYLWDKKEYDKSLKYIKSRLSVKYNDQRCLNYLFELREGISEPFLMEKVNKIIDDYFIKFQGTVTELSNDFGSMNLPIAISSDHYGNFYISDHFNNRVVKMDREGTPLLEIRYSDNNNIFSPIGTVVNRNGDVFVCDHHNHIIRVFNKEGKLIRNITDDSIRLPYALFIDNQDKLWVTEWEGNIIKIFTQDGNFLREASITEKYNFTRGATGIFIGDQNGANWFADYGGNCVVSEKDNRIDIYGEKGSDPGQFQNPISIAFDNNGNIFVTDETSRIQKFSSNFELLNIVWLPNYGCPNNIEIANDVMLVADSKNSCIHIYKLYLDK